MPKKNTDKLKGRMKDEGAIPLIGTSEGDAEQYRDRVSMLAPEQVTELLMTVIDKYVSDDEMNGFLADLEALNAAATAGADAALGGPVAPPIPGFPGGLG